MAKCKANRLYAPEFRRQMVGLIRSGRNLEELAREFEPSAQAIRNWVAQADRDAGRRTDGLTTAERDELSRLRRENRQLKLEREILSKAAAQVLRGRPARSRRRIRVREAIRPSSGFSCAMYWASLPAGTTRGWSVRHRGERGAVLATRIREIHTRSRGMLHAELADEGTPVGRKRVARLMARLDLAGVSRRRGFKTTVRDRATCPAPDPVARRFTAARPDQLWVADITYVPTLAGFLFLAVVLDVCTRRIRRLGDGQLLAYETDPGRAQHGRPAAPNHRCDPSLGSGYVQYTSSAFGLRCKEAGMRPSMGSIGDW